MPRFSVSDCSVTSLRFGRYRRLVLLLAWLEWLPDMGPFPVSSQRRDMGSSSSWVKGATRPCSMQMGTASGSAPNSSLGLYVQSRGASRDSAGEFAPAQVGTKRPVCTSVLYQIRAARRGVCTKRRELPRPGLCRAGCDPCATGLG